MSWSLQRSNQRTRLYEVQTSPMTMSPETERVHSVSGEKKVHALVSM
jgi:hypothetical protein